MSLSLVLVLWLAASIPLAVATGRGIGRRATHSTSEPSELHDRLAQVELREIPRVRRAIGGWVDDPYLAGELRELRAEAERLRGLLGLTDRSGGTRARRRGRTGAPHRRSVA